MLFDNIYKTVEDFKSNAKYQYKQEQIFTKRGQLRKNRWAYLQLYTSLNTEGLEISFTTTDYSGKRKRFSSMKIEAYRYFFDEKIRKGKQPFFAKIYAVHLFKNKAEIDNMTEKQWNQILSKLEKQYKEYLVNESLHRIEQDF